jgi:transcriptional regulator with XRE-family HTH domain
MDPALQLAFGEHVRTLRRERGHSQEDFAALANLDRSAFGKIERGTINVGLISMARIAAALDLTLSQLLEGVAFDKSEIKSLPRSSRGPKSGLMKKGS